MKYYSDYSDLQEALAKADRFGAISFTSAKTGNLILEDSQVEMYNKIQKLLNCDAMESAHGYLYNLDPEELTEAEASKVNNLWKLGCEKGFIQDFTEEDEDTEKDVEECDAVQAQASNLTPATPAQQQVAANALQAMNTKCDAFTILYSAMRDGAVKTGETYSNAINPRSAKADVISRLERAGYSNISILAIECGDPDCCGADCSNTYVKQADMTPIASDPTTTDVTAELPDYAADTSFEAEEDKDAAENVDEADDKEADDKEADKADDEKADDKSDEDKEADGKKEDKKAEKAEEPDEKLKDDADAEKKAEDAEDDELDAAEKASLKDSYKKAFKAAMLKCKFEDRAFEDLTLEEKVEFFTALSTAWGSKADPSKFMEPKEVEQLEKIKVKK